jgi:hypothetical protein
MNIWAKMATILYLNFPKMITCTLMYLRNLLMRPTDITSSMINKIGESPFYLNQNAAEMLNNLSDDYLTQTGYLESIASKAPIRNGLPIPWITYPALEFLEKSVSSSSRILEFGGGFSTLFWALRGNPISYMENNVLCDDSIYQVGKEFRNLLGNSITRISELLTSDMRTELKTSLVREITISKVEFSEHLNDFFVDQINPQFNANEKGYTLEDTLRTQVVFPSIYGLRPSPDDRIDLSFAFSNNDKPFKHIYAVNNINPVHVGEYFTLWQIQLEIEKSGGDIEKQISSYWSFFDFEKKILPLDNVNVLTRIQQRTSEIVNHTNENNFDRQSGLFLENSN